MSDEHPCQATDPAELRRQIMSSLVPKNEREHWAARKIAQLEADIALATEVIQKSNAWVAEAKPLLEKGGEAERELVAAQALIAEEQAAKFVPGCWRCAKCNFELNKSVLYVKGGGIGPDLGRPEPCPNDGEPMQRVSWKDDAMRVAKVCTGQVERAVKAESQRDALVMAMNNILFSSKWSGTPPTAYAKIAREVLAAVEFPEGCETDVGVRMDEGQRQMIVLALAKLTFARPGWNHALREAAKKLHGEEMFDEFVSHGPDIVAKIE